MDEIQSFLSLSEPANEQTQGDAGSIYNQIRSDQGTFWDLVHAPFMARDMTRGTILDIYNLALAGGGGVKGAAVRL
ncbi:MAG: hypothetical protein ABUK01_17885, partial [Leptospirales bacterium]